MPTRPNCRAPQPSPAGKSRLPAAPLSARERIAASPPQAEPIRRWGRPAEQTLSAGSVSPSAPGGALAFQTQALEQLELQSQILLDLLGAVNGLTAAVLAQGGKG